jgi:Holliday junction DNA helicase RuvA
MIGKLTGTIDSFGNDHVLLDVGGVGYLVFASRRTMTRIGQPGDRASLLIDTHVREDHIHLFGFADANEQRWFRLLTSVQGVGAKVGMALLGTLTPDQISLAIASQDKAMITQADGVGPKLAVRILTELKEKVGQIEIQQPITKTNRPTEATSGPANLQHDAISALVNLGYGRAEAFTAVSQAAHKANDNEKTNLQILIRLALKEISA